METKIENALREEAVFGDLVEITLKLDIEYCARHDQNSVLISPRENVIGYQERGILHISGYYGGMQKGSFKEFIAVLGRGALPVLITDSTDAETVVCLNPTLHRENAIDNLHFQGEGLVKIPISTIASYEILSKKGRGLRVVN